MPALSLPVLGFALGVLLSWSAAEPLRQTERATQSDAMWIVTLFGLLIHAPCAAYLLTYSTDWCLAYMAAPHTLPPGLLPALGAVNLVAVPAGFLAGASGARRGQLLPPLQWAAAALGVILINTLVFWSRLSVEASYVEFHNDFGVSSIAGSALGYALLWMALIVTASILWTQRTLRHSSHPS